MSMARCNQCGRRMTHAEFDQHDCPGNPGPPLDGESWLDYKARCAKWRQDRGLPTGWEDEGETCDICGDWIEIHDGQPVCKSGCAQVTHKGGAA